MTESRSADLAALILRVALGGLFLTHWALKMFVFTPAGVVHFFGSLGLPEPLAYLTLVAEVVIGIGLVLGIATRWVALAGVPILLGAIFTVHGANGFFFTAQGGGWEYPGFWALALVVQALLGDGAAALGPKLIPGLSAQPKAA